MEEKLLYRKPCLYVGDSFKLGCATGSAASGDEMIGTTCQDGTSPDTTEGAGCGNGNGDSQNYYADCQTGQANSTTGDACSTGNNVT